MASILRKHRVSQLLTKDGPRAVSEVLNGKYTLLVFGLVPTVPAAATVLCDDDRQQQLQDAMKGDQQQHPAPTIPLQQELLHFYNTMRKDVGEHAAALPPEGKIDRDSPLEIVYVPVSPVPLTPRTMASPSAASGDAGSNVSSTCSFSRSLSDASSLSVGENFSMPREESNTRQGSMTTNIEFVNEEALEDVIKHNFAKLYELMPWAALDPLQDCEAVEALRSSFKGSNFVLLDANGDDVLVDDARELILENSKFNFAGFPWKAPENLPHSSVAVELPADTLAAAVSRVVQLLDAVNINNDTDDATNSSILEAVSNLLVVFNNHNTQQLNSDTAEPQPPEAITLRDFSRWEKREFADMLAASVGATMGVFARQRLAAKFVLFFRNVSTTDTFNKHAPSPPPQRFESNVGKTFQSTPNDPVRVFPATLDDVEGRRHAAAGLAARLNQGGTSYRPLSFRAILKELESISVAHDEDILRDVVGRLDPKLIGTLICLLEAVRMETIRSAQEMAVRTFSCDGNDDRHSVHLRRLEAALTSSEVQHTAELRKVWKHRSLYLDRNSNTEARAEASKELIPLYEQPQTAGNNDRHTDHSRRHHLVVEELQEGHRRPLDAEERDHVLISAHDPLKTHQNTDRKNLDNNTSSGGPGIRLASTGSLVVPDLETFADRFNEYTSGAFRYFTWDGSAFVAGGAVLGCLARWEQQPAAGKSPTTTTLSLRQDLEEALWSTFGVDVSQRIASYVHSDDNANNEGRHYIPRRFPDTTLISDQRKPSVADQPHHHQDQQQQPSFVAPNSSDIDVFITAKNEQDAEFKLLRAAEELTAGMADACNEKILSQMTADELKNEFIPASEADYYDTRSTPHSQRRSYSGFASYHSVSYNRVFCSDTRFEEVQKNIACKSDRNSATWTMKEYLRRRVRLMRSGNALTLFVGYPVRNIQIVVIIHRSMHEMLTYSDLDCVTFAYDGRQVYGLPRGVRALQTATNFVEPAKLRRWSTPPRLVKYAGRGFDTLLFELCKHRPRCDVCLDAEFQLRVENIERGIASKIPEDHNAQPYQVEWEYKSLDVPYLPNVRDVSAFLRYVARRGARQSRAAAAVVTRSNGTATATSRATERLSRGAVGGTAATIGVSTAAPADGIRPSSSSQPLRSSSLLNTSSPPQRFVLGCGLNIKQTLFPATADNPASLLPGGWASQKVEVAPIRWRLDDLWATRRGNEVLPPCKMCGSRIDAATTDAERPLICNACERINKQKFENLEEVSLSGFVAIVTGARVKVGFHTALKLLRMGATVHITTRFGVDAMTRYARQPDFDAFRTRLVVHQVDFTQIESVTAFTDSIQSPINILVNCAAQTIVREPEYYKAALDVIWGIDYPANTGSPVYDVTGLQEIYMNDVPTLKRRQERAQEEGGEPFEPLSDPISNMHFHSDCFISSNLEKNILRSSRMLTTPGAVESVLPAGMPMIDEVREHRDAAVAEAEKHNATTPPIKPSAIPPSLPSALVLHETAKENSRQMTERRNPFCHAPINPQHDTRQLDIHGEVVDKREHTSWTSTIKDNVSIVEATSAILVNSVVPLHLVHALRHKFVGHGGCDAKSEKTGGAGAHTSTREENNTITPERCGYIINVTSQEGTFANDVKGGIHPHTNMSKASMNMITRTMAAELCDPKQNAGQCPIYMNSVDSGWVSQMTGKQLTPPPLSMNDSVARILDPIVEPIRQFQRERQENGQSCVDPLPIANPPHGQLFKHFKPTKW